MFATCNGQSWSVLKVLKTINPLTPRAFYQKHTFWIFWRFSACIWAKLAPIYSKRHWQLDILLFPIVSQFMTFLLRHAQKSKFRDFWTRKWHTALGFSFCYFFFCFRFFLLFLSFCCSDWPSTQRSKLRPFWSPWRVKKKIGHWIIGESGHLATKGYKLKRIKLTSRFIAF